MVILGIDYGTRWIGLALGDTETKFAFPYKTLERKAVQPTTSKARRTLERKAVQPTTSKARRTLERKAVQPTTSKASRTLEREAFALPYIENACKSETVEQIIIGLPKLWQNPTPLQKEIEAFGTMLRARLQMPVEFTEEIFTSELAKILSPARARHSTHAQAATLILENYFTRISKS